MIRRRSWLFVPGDDPTNLAKAHRYGADVLIIDLEDAVAADRKAAARAALPESIATISSSGAGIAVRINNLWRDSFYDLQAAVRADVDVIVVPKVEDAARIATITEMIRELEAEKGLRPGRIKLNALIESPLGLRNLDAIAATERTDVISLGTEDFSLVLGVPPTAESLDMPCRLMALTAHAHGIDALAMPISIASHRDEAAITAAAARANAIGLTGALCIHPRQVSVVNAQFGSTEAARAQAIAILSAWETLGGEQHGVISWNGEMVDRPIVLRMRRLLTRTP